MSSQNMNYRVQDCKDGKLTTWEELEVAMETKSLFIKYDRKQKYTERGLESPSLATELKTNSSSE